MTYTDQNLAPELHAPGCEEWCNHCALCGEGILYGARCQKHYGVYPKAGIDGPSPEALEWMRKWRENR